MNKKILFAFPLIGCLLAGCATPKAYDYSEYITSVKWENPEKDFKILQLCDIHLSQSDIYERHLGLINKTINDAKPNLIVINGDSFTYADKKVVNLLFKFIDSYDIPWTFTYGNHDDQGYYSDAYIQRLLDSDEFKNVRFINNEDDDVTGRSNFCINIYQEDASGKKSTKFQVYCFESHSYNFDTLAYDFIKQDQIDWYRGMVNYSTEINGYVVPSAAYFHIPLPEFFTAWNDYKEGKPNSTIPEGFDSKASTDELGGGPTPETDTHLFDVMQELGSTKAISCAHDHINDSVLYYTDKEGENPIYLCFGVHSTDRIYYDEAKLGGQLIIVDHNNPSKLSFKNIKNSYKDVEVK